MKIEVELPIYEKNGSESEVGGDDKVLVKSHWNRDEFVVIRVGKDRVTLSAADMIEAVKRASGWKW